MINDYLQIFAPCQRIFHHFSFWERQIVCKECCIRYVVQVWYLGHVLHVVLGLHIAVVFRPRFSTAAVVGWAGQRLHLDVHVVLVSVLVTVRFFVLLQHAKDGLVSSMLSQTPSPPSLHPPLSPTSFPPFLSMYFILPPPPRSPNWWSSTPSPRLSFTLFLSLLSSSFFVL